MQIFLPENAKFILNTLQNAGFKAYVVGGCVRNLLLGFLPTDFDICTNARPQEIKSLFNRTADTGIKHGTVTVIIGGKPFEVTTFRTDGAYKDYRHPDNVRFSDNLRDDLSRRDFTVNAICYNDKEGLVDYFGGQNDLKNKMLRSVGNADLRFREDALRILRLFRFSSVLGFSIESETYRAALNNSNLLKNISYERISQELFKISCGSNPMAVMPLLKTGAINGIRTSDISKIPLLPEKPYLKFFAFLSLTSPDIKKTLDIFKCSNSFKNYATRLYADIFTDLHGKPDIKKALRRLEDDIFDLLEYKSVILGEDTENIKQSIKEILKSGEPYKVSQLAVNGYDIKKNFSGAEIGEKLEYLLERVIENPDLNNKDKLLKLI